MTFIITRRQMLTGATLAAAAGAAAYTGRSLSALASVTVGPNPRKTGGDALVVVFLRGGADGLNIVAPHGEDEYHRQRPSLALARPNDRKSDPKARALDLDGFFGLHPSLAPLLPLYQNGQMGIVHAIGSGDKTRSHFEAMATMERGIASDTGAASGWLARHLDSTADPNDSPLRAVAITDTMPDSLRGATSATSLTSLADYKLAMPALMPTGSDNKTFHAPPPDKRADAVTETLRGLYATNAGSPDALQSAGRETLAALDAIRQLDPAHYKPASGADYPEQRIGQRTSAGGLPDQRQHRPGSGLPGYGRLGHACRAGPRCGLAACPPCRPGPRPRRVRRRSGNRHEPRHYRRHDRIRAARGGKQRAWHGSRTRQLPVPDRRGRGGGKVHGAGPVWPSINWKTRAAGRAICASRRTTATCWPKSSACA